MNKADLTTIALIHKIDVWCRRTGQPEGLIGIAVLNHAGFAAQLRSRGTLRPDTAKKVMAFMDAFPDKASLPFEIVQELKLAARSGRPWQPPAKASPGPAVVAATPVPAAKPRIPAAVIRAAAVDGRDLGAFVSALILMGLDCWREDRAANGEAVA